LKRGLPLGLPWAGGFVLALAHANPSLQFQRGSSTCPLNPGHKVHVHGLYDRYANCDDEQKEDIPRFLCVPCGHTISVLPDRFLPYRPVAAPLVEQHLTPKPVPGTGSHLPSQKKKKVA